MKDNIILLKINDCFKTIGVPELVVAMFPILAAYPYFVGVISLLMVALNFVIRRAKPYWYMPIVVYLVYFLLHEILLGTILDEIPSSFINRTFMMFISYMLIFYITPYLDYDKFYYSMMWVSVISIIGILYHVYVLFFTFSPVEMIQIPFLPQVEFRDGGLMRPCSFFMEPSAYASYMVMALAFCLIRKKLVMAAIITISVLLSTSTNGYAFVVIMWILYLSLSKQIALKKKIWVVILMSSVIIWGYSNGYFDDGIKKIEKTDTSDDIRLTAGFYFYQDLPNEYRIFGVDTPTIYDFLIAHPGVKKGNYKLAIIGDSVYLPMFWEQSIKFGILGIILYLFCFFSFCRLKPLWPYLVICFISMFTQSGTPFFQLMFLLLIRNHSIKLRSLGQTL